MAMGESLARCEVPLPADEQVKPSIAVAERPVRREDPALVILGDAPVEDDGRWWPSRERAADRCVVSCGDDAVGAEPAVRGPLAREERRLLPRDPAVVRREGEGHEARVRQGSVRLEDEQ